MLSTVDGVPIASCGPRSDSARSLSHSNEVSAGNDDSLAAMALNWLGELQSSTSPLGWGESERVLLRCARGSLLMQRCRGAVLVVMLARGVSSDDIRLPMAGAVARIERSNRSSAQAPTPVQPNPAGALPSKRVDEPANELSKSTKTHPEKA